MYIYITYISIFTIPCRFVLFQENMTHTLNRTLNA